MTIFDGIVTALLEGLWELLLLTPGRLMALAWGIPKDDPRSGLWTFVGTLFFWTVLTGLILFGQG